METHAVGRRAAARLLALGLLALIRQAAAESDGPRPPVAADAWTADLLKTGLYLISSAGANTLMRLSPAGAVLVDGQNAGSYRPLMSQVRRINKISDLPVRFLVLTNHRADHAGNLAPFTAAGVGVLVQERARARLPALETPAGKPPPIVVGFDRDYVLRIGGVELRLHHFGKARTDGDSVVLFPDLKIAAVGDLYAAGAPQPDFAAGGSLVGWPLVLEQVLKLDADLFVPSQGSPVTRFELEAFKARLGTLVARAGALVRSGVPKADFLARCRTDDLGWQLNFTGDGLDSLYAELLHPV